MSEIHVPVTFDADNNPHIRQPHTSERGAHEHALQLGAADKSIWRYEVLTFDLIDDAGAAPASGSTHIGREWDSHEIEDGCPCPKAPCGLVVRETVVEECDQHPLQAAKTMRQSHRADQCPAQPPAEPELAALRELRAVAGHFADTWFELMVTLPDDYECEMNCAEANAVADLYRALGMDDSARSIVAAHAATDDDEERASHDEAGELTSGAT